MTASQVDALNVAAEATGKAKKEIKLKMSVGHVRALLARMEVNHEFA
jgi:hypothetical protein